MLSRGKSKERTSSRKVTPPSPSYMSNDQFAAYLADLRKNRISRPGGARPQPDNARRNSGRLSMGNRSSLGGASLSDASSMQPQSPQPAASARSLTGRPSIAASVSSRYSTTSGAGHDYYPDKDTKVVPLKPSEVVPTASYIERGQRWMEKEEAFSLKQAMDHMDIKSEAEKEGTEDKEEEEGDKRLYDAALNEAADLVWKHQNGVKPPEPGAPYRYRPHLRKNSYAHARTASAGYYGEDIAPSGLGRDHSSRSVSGSSTSSNGSVTRRGRVSLGSTSNGGAALPRHSQDSSRRSSIEAEPPKPYRGLASGPRPMAKAPVHRRRSSLKRNISGEVQKPFSGDQIWEEPEAPSPARPKARGSDDAAQADAAVHPLRLKPKNPLNRVQFAEDASPATPPPKTPQHTGVVSKLLNKIEIHRNPPSQSRNPQYTTNSSSPAANADSDVKSNSDAGATEPAAAPRDDVPRKNGVEIRGDDIRQATSMRLKDRSSKLPTPSFVSDSPGRPIVSFDAHWKAPDEAGTDKEPEPDKFNRSPFSRARREARQGGAAPAPVAPVAPHSLPARQETASVPAVPAVADRHPPAPAPSRSAPLPAIHIDTPGDGPASIPAIPVIAVSEAASPSSFSSQAAPRRPAPSAAPVPSISVTDSAPPIPTIVLPGEPENDDGDTGGPSIPVIVTPDDANTSAASPSSSRSQSARPLPTPGKHRGRTAAARPRGHWSPAPQPPHQAVGNRATARCHECRFPIEGRFVKLAGSEERFHPQCFSCYACGTPLEALEISPEPDPARRARLDRIRRRAAGEMLEEKPGETMGEDGDERLRFFCHLDWHESFAPRCRHCRTPIIGEHVVALGEHWHYGHFFCAECGDPFNEGMTHIEKDGYAWCVSCQTKRTERRAPKCKGCRTAVIGQYVRALGGEWHDECFRCATCGGGFDDGQIFPREAAGGQMQILCTPCRTRELKE